MGFIQFPMRKGWKRGHRMVVLPDYQGVGIGTAFGEFTSQYYADLGWNVNITTTTPALVNALRKSKKWVLARFGRSKGSMMNFARYATEGNEKIKKTAELFVKTQSNDRITYSFNFKK